MLVARGYQRRAMTFERTRGEAQVIVAVQRSASSTAEQTQFSVNVGVVLAAITTLTPVRPGDVVLGGIATHISARLGPVWCVAANTDVAVMAQQLIAAATPMLDSVDDIVDGPTALVRWTGPWNVTRAQLHYQAGDMRQAAAELEAFVARSARTDLTPAWLAARYGMPRLARISPTA